MRAWDGRSLRRALRTDRGLLGSVLAVCGAIVLTVAVPLTSSAFTATITDSRNQAAAKQVFTCADVFAGERRRSSAYFQYALREPAGATTATDSSSRGNGGAYDGSNTKDGSSPQPCAADPGSAYALDGSTSRVLTSRQFPPIRSDFSIEIWFKTAARSEKLIGFESSPDGTSSNYDKHLYVGSDGRLHYGVYNGDVSTADSTATVDDGVWHQAVATTSPTDGSVLYLDGVQVATLSKTTAEDFPGYWRIGEGKLEQWPDAPAFSHFTGSIAFAAAYGTVLTAAEVRSAYEIGKPGPTASASPTATATATATPATEAPATQSPTLAPDGGYTVSSTPTPTPTGATQAPPGVVETNDDQPIIITTPQE